MFKVRAKHTDSGVGDGSELKPDTSAPAGEDATASGVTPGPMEIEGETRGEITRKHGSFGKSLADYMEVGGGVAAFTHKWTGTRWIREKFEDMKDWQVKTSFFIALPIFALHYAAKGLTKFEDLWGATIRRLRKTKPVQDTVRNAGRKRFNF